MSPRSEEFMLEAQDRLAAARVALEAGFPPAATSLAYYAMLYAARAALSEEDRYAKTHKGTWDLFFQFLVGPARFDEQLAGAARGTQPLREASDYDAARISSEDAGAVVELADRFVGAVVAMLGD